MIGQITSWLQNWVWGSDPQTLPPPHRWAVLTARLLHVLARDVRGGQITLRAMGLVYTTLLSLVPLLALTFSLLKGFGVHNVVRPVLERFLAPLGDQAGDLVDLVVRFVENVQVGVLGAVGLALLIYSVISLIQKLESGCNYIWQARRARSLGRRFSEYLSVLIVGPLVILAGTSMTAAALNNTLVQTVLEVEPFGAALYMVSRLLPYFVYTAGFTFLFLFMPNTKVRFLPALAGGLFSGVLWQTASFAFATFASNAGNVNAIYSSFAIGVLLLIWLYLSWMILLLGCRVAFLLQYPENLSRIPYPPRLGARREEELSLLVMTLVGYNFLQGHPPWHIEHLARYLRAVPAHVYHVIDQLVDAQLLVETDEPDTFVLPRRDIDTITVDDILTAARRGDPANAPNPPDKRPYREVQDLLQRLDKSRYDAIGSIKLKQLARETAAHD